MRSLVLSLAFLVPCALAIAPPMQQGAFRARPVAPATNAATPDSLSLGNAHAGKEEKEAALLDVRRSLQKTRKMHRQAKVQALRLSRSSRAAAEAIYAEASLYETKLAELEDMQRTLMRQGRAAVLREQRTAKRKFKDWRRSGRDEL